jgi:hypothetical protein
VARFIPRIGVNALDATTPSGVICVQHYEYENSAEAAPIFELKANDGRWYTHFAAEAERMWAKSVPWPLAPDERLARLGRPVFVESFGRELSEAMDTAQDILITGVTRNGFIRDHYGKLESWLSRGRRVRILLIDPTSDAIAVAADRYYAERSASTARERVEQSKRLLLELSESSRGDLEVRLSRHPLSVGLIAIDSTPETRNATSVAFLEYYSYRAAGEPKLILQPTDGVWFQHFINEAEELWNSALPFRQKGD